MGSLRFFDLAKLRVQYQAPLFFETGSGKGHGVQYAQTVSFTEIRSVEIMDVQARYLAALFATDRRVEIISSNSFDALREWLPKLTANTIFYLDAHFPGADLGLRGFADETDEDLRLPLLKELEMIRDVRVPLGYRDVILIDDIMIFDEENAYPSEGWKRELDIKPRNLINGYRQILSVLSPSHDVKVIPEDSGFALITPKAAPVNQLELAL